MLQPSSPIVVDVIRQPEAARDISVDTVLGIFALAGAFLAACLVVALLGAGTFVLYRRIRGVRPDASLSATALNLSSPPASPGDRPRAGGPQYP